MAEPIPGEFLIRRRLDRERELIIARAQVGGLFAAYEQHVETWGLPIDPLRLVMMRQALGGVALHLSCRPLDETSAFTFNFVEPPTNIFVAGNSGEEVVTGRVWNDDVDTSQGSRLFVQTNRKYAKSFTSVIDTQGLDLLLILEDYAARSVQAPIRLFEIEDDEYLMVASLPKEDREWFFEIDRDEALRLYDEARDLDEKTFRFYCGCDPARMRKAITTMFGNRLDELFEGDPSVDISCPRCGRGWTVRREDVEPGRQES